MKRLTSNIALAGVILAGAALYKTAERVGWIAPDHDGRYVQAIIGFTLVAFANFIPKNLGRWRGAEAARRAQIVSRVAGWSFALAGIAYAALWLTAPLAIADPVSIAAVVCALAVTFACTVWACAARRDDVASAPARNS